MCRQQSGQEKVVQCPEGPVFTADRSGTKIPPGRPSGLAVQRETVIVSQNDSSKRLLFDSSNDDSAKRFLFCRIILRNDYCFPLDSAVQRAVQGGFSTTPVSSKEEPLWTLDNFLVTCPLSHHHTHTLKKKGQRYPGVHVCLHR